MCPHPHMHTLGEWRRKCIWNSCSRIDFSGIVNAKWSDGDFQIPDQIQALSCPPAVSRLHIKLETTCLCALCACTTHCAEIFLKQFSTLRLNHLDALPYLQSIPAKNLCYI